VVRDVEPKDILHLLLNDFFVDFIKVAFQQIARPENTKDFLGIIR